MHKWRNILWSDETTLLICLALKEVTRKLKIHPQYTIKTIKHGGGSILVWGCFSCHCTGHIFSTEGIMHAIYYINILSDVLMSYADVS